MIMNLIPNLNPAQTLAFRPWAEVVETIDEITVVDKAKNKKAKKTTPITVTDKNGIKVIATYAPTDRPTYKEWVQNMGINEITYQYHPDAKPKADQINLRMGTVEWFLTRFERITGIRWH